jgi:hypothetical protein
LKQRCNDYKYKPPVNPGKKGKKPRRSCNSCDWTGCNNFKGHAEKSCGRLRAPGKVGAHKGWTFLKSDNTLEDDSKQIVMRIKQSEATTKQRANKDSKVSKKLRKMIKKKTRAQHGSTALKNFSRYPMKAWNQYSGQEGERALEYLVFGLMAHKPKTFTTNRFNRGAARMRAEIDDIKVAFDNEFQKKGAEGLTIFDMAYEKMLVHSKGNKYFYDSADEEDDK